MTRPDILVCGSYPDWDRDALEAAYTLHPLPGSGSPADLPEDTRQKIRGVAFKGHGALTPAFIDALPGLEIIANFGVGYDTIDTAYAAQKGIPVTNTPDVLTDEVADLTVGMIVTRNRDLVGADAWVRSGRWATEGEFPLQRKTSGRSVGIVGLGRIGLAIGRRLEPFGMALHYHARSPKPGGAAWTYHADLVAMARAVEILIICLPGGAATKAYVGRAALEALGPEGLLVNIARGTTVDEAALLDCLESGALGQAALDVFLGEPAIDPRFAALSNVLLLPHIGSATVETRKAMGALQRQNLAAHFAGEPLLTPVP